MTKTALIDWVVFALQRELEPREENMQRVIVCAAMRDTETGKVICSVRHWDELVQHHFDRKQAIEFNDEQGFVDNKYQFLTRTEAWQVAEAAGQIKRRVGGDTIDGGTLFSENLY